MTVQQTSVDVYRKGLDSGLIKNLAAEVFALIMEYGPISSRMVHQRYCDQIQQRDTRSVCPRISELKDLGVIEQSHVEPCQVTGNKAIYWRIAMACPAHIQKPKKKLSNKDAVKKLLHTIYDIESLLNNPEAEVTRQKIKDIIAEGLHDAGV